LTFPHNLEQTAPRGEKLRLVDGQHAAVGHQVEDAARVVDRHRFAGQMHLAETRVHVAVAAVGLRLDDHQRAVAQVRQRVEPIEQRARFAAFHRPVVDLEKSRVEHAVEDVVDHNVDPRVGVGGAS